jgi:glycosyltransferase involved in cell wall biosynthesis
MSSDYSISVVIPAYNATRTLPATVASIEAQTVQPLEVIVVDDGSSDATVDVAGELGARVVQQANAGHAAARNTGVAAAQGRYVAFVDADDLWLPEKLERQLDEIRCNPEIRALQTGAARVNDDLQLLWSEECRRPGDQLWETLCFQNLPALMSTLMIERAFFDEIGGFDASLIILQDWDLAIRLARRNQLHAIPDVLSAYRYFDTSQSANVEIHIDPGLRVLEKLFADPTLPPEVRAKRRAAYARFYAMLCGGSIRVGEPRGALSWGRKALRNDPRVAGYIAAFPLRRLSRRRQAAEPSALELPATVLEANQPLSSRVPA